MGQINVSSASGDIAALVARAEGLLDWEGTPSKAVEVLPDLEAHIGSEEAERDPRYLMMRGVARYLVDRDDEAKADYLSVLTAAPADLNTRIRAFCRLAQVDTYMDRFDEARRWLENAEGLLREDTLPELKGEVHFRQGCLASDCGDTETAADAFRQAAALFADAPGRFARWLDARVGEAERLLNHRNPLAADELARRIAMDATDLGVPEAIVTPRLVDLVTSAYSLGHSDGVVEWLRSDSVVRSSLPARLRVHIGRIHWTSGDVSLAARHFEIAAHEPDADADDRWFAQLNRHALAAEKDDTKLPQVIGHALTGLQNESSVSGFSQITASKLLMDLGAFSVAETICRHIVDGPAAQNPLLRAMGSTNLVGILASQGRLKEAIEARRAFEIDDLQGDLEFVGVCLLNDAFLFVMQGQWEQAVDRIAGFMENLRRTGDITQLAVALQNAAEWADMVNQSDAALDYLIELEGLLPKLSGRVRLTGLLHVAVGASERALWSLAESLLAEAAEAADEFGDVRLILLVEFRRLLLALDMPLPRAVSTNVPAVLHEDLEHRLKALEQRCGGIPDLVGFVGRVRGIVAVRRGLVDAACIHFRRAARVFLRVGRLYDYADSLDWIARVMADPDAAVPSATRAVRVGLSLVALSPNDSTRSRALARMRPMGEWLVGLHVTRGDAVRTASAIYEVKAGEFLRKNQVVAGLSNEARKALESAVAVASANLNKSSSSPSEATLRRAPVQPEQRLPNVAALVTDMLAADPNVADARVSAREVLRWLRPSDAAVEYFYDTEKTRLIIVVLKSGEATTIVRRVREPQLRAMRSVADGASGRLFGGDPRWLRNQLRELHDLLIGPLRNLPDRSKRLWLAPGGLLTHVPFAALLDRQGRALLDRADLRMLVTTAQLTRLPRRQPRRRRALVLRGDDGAAVQLAHADAECRDVVRELGQAGVNVGQSIDNDTLAEIDVLHYAGHARVDPNVGDGWLALPGRLLATSDFASLPLHRRPLVVLSACESGATVEGSDGLTGFIRAGFAAGARNIVCSGWLADDESTRHLMVEFYRRLGMGDEPAHALRLASIATREARAEWAHPFFWANFRCYGHG